MDIGIGFVVAGMADVEGAGSTCVYSHKEGRFEM